MLLALAKQLPYVKKKEKKHNKEIGWISFPKKMSLILMTGFREK